MHLDLLVRACDEDTEKYQAIHFQEEAMALSPHDQLIIEILETCRPYHGDSAGEYMRKASHILALIRTFLQES